MLQHECHKLRGTPRRSENEGKRRHRRTSRDKTRFESGGAAASAATLRTSVFPERNDSDRADCPKPFFNSTSAPLKALSSSAATSSFPLAHAQCRGVFPDELMLHVAPALIRASQQPRWPFAAAWRTKKKKLLASLLL